MGSPRIIPAPKAPLSLAHNESLLKARKTRIIAKYLPFNTRMFILLMRIS
jgi:hypothetical protein